MKKLLLFLTIGFTTFSFSDPVYTEKTIVDKIEILEDGQIQIREATIVYRDGVEITRTYKRHCVAPDIAPAELLNEDARVQAVCGVIHTKDVKDKYKEKKAKIK